MHRIAYFITPHVFGHAPLILSVRLDLTLTDVKDILRDTADKIKPASSDTGNPVHSVAFGYGRINAAAAVQAAQVIRRLAVA